MVGIRCVPDCSTIRKARSKAISSLDVSIRLHMKRAERQSEAVSAKTTRRNQHFAGTPDRTRTCDLLLRRQLLYPAELPGPVPRLAGEILDFALLRMRGWLRSAAHTPSRRSSRFASGPLSFVFDTHNPRR